MALLQGTVLRLRHDLPLRHASKLFKYCCRSELSLFCKVSWSGIESHETLDVHPGCVQHRLFVVITVPVPCTNCSAAQQRVVSSSSLMQTKLEHRKLVQDCSQYDVDSRLSKTWNAFSRIESLVQTIPSKLVSGQT